MDDNKWEFELKIKDGTIFIVLCSNEDMDKLINLIGSENILDCEPL